MRTLFLHAVNANHWQEPVECTSRCLVSFCCHIRAVIDRDTSGFYIYREVKSVTIWFQNKRQTERKVALHNSTNITHNVRDVAHSSSSPFTSGMTSRSTSSSSSRPSLDNVASRSELRVPAPHTPSRRRHPNTTLWDNMLSSPLAPPTSPPAREYVEFGKNQRTRTLEWACAAARLAEKDGGVHSRDEGEMLDLGEETEDDIDEAITPACTWEGGDTRWTTEPGGRMTVLHKGVQDDDMMRAALALCGLGRQ